MGAGQSGVHTRGTPQSLYATVALICSSFDADTFAILLCIIPALLFRIQKLTSISLGCTTLQVLRVYVGSFWDYPIMDGPFKALFEAEHGDLLRDLANLPKFSTVRKINELVKRARMLKVRCHMCEQCTLFLFVYRGRYP